MALPETEEKLFWHEITVMEKEEKMRYMTNGERLDFKRGMEQGVQQGKAMLLSRQMAKRYHISPEMLTIQWESLNDDELSELGDKILEWDSFDMILQWVEQRKKQG